MYNLQVESFGRMPFDDILSLYRQGYKLADGRVNIGSMATCGMNTVQVGGKLTLSANAIVGTPPYTYHWSIKKPDGNIDTVLTGENNLYTFSQAGDYTISVFVTDSCPGGAKTSEVQTCTVTATVGGDGGNGGGGGGGAACTSNADCPDGYCIGGKCYSKNTVYIGGAAVGLIALVILSK